MPAWHGRAMTSIIRPALSSDVAALSALKLAAFRETFLDGFAIPYPPADLALSLIHISEPTRH